MDETLNIAIFCDFENVAIGVRDAKYDQFDINLVLERLLDKGKIVVKKAYADWDRYRSSKRPMHEAAFELIEIPHLSYSGKNSADIRMVVDALDLCYTKTHLDMFVLISGDSDFSPLVSKLRENNKKVLGMGVKSATSDLLVDNCDEFIYYDDLVREKRKAKPNVKGGKPRLRDKENGRKEDPKRAPAPAGTAAASPAGPTAVVPATSATPSTPAAPATSATSAYTVTAANAVSSATLSTSVSPAAPKPAEADEGGEEKLTLKEQAMDMVLDIVEALFRDHEGSLYGSMVKQTIKRKRPNFSETYHGYRNFNQLLEEAEQQGLLELQKDEKSGGYLILAFGPNA